MIIPRIASSVPCKDWNCYASQFGCDKDWSLTDCISIERDAKESN